MINTITENKAQPKGKEEKTMTEYTAKKAQELRIPATSTPEKLRSERFTFQSAVVNFGNLTIVASYMHRGNGKNGYFWAAYKIEGGVEDETKLDAVSNDFYEDEGHALKAAFEWAAQWA